MCTGVEIAYVAGMVLAAGGAVHQAQTQANYQEYQADQAEADARAEAGMAKVEAERIRKAAKKQRSEAIAAMAASGMDVNSSTALKIDEQITRDSEEDAALVMFGADDRSRRLQAEAGGYRNMASNTRNSGYVAATSSLLRAGTNSGRGWKRPAGGTGG